MTRLAELHGLPTDPATPEELANAIVKYVRANDHVSFAELARLWPEHFHNLHGRQLALDAAPNVIVWSGVSDTGYAAMELVRPRTTVEPATAMAYLLDGLCLNLPRVRAKSKKAMKNYKTPHWAPAVLRPKG